MAVQVSNGSCQYMHTFERLRLGSHSNSGRPLARGYITRHPVDPKSYSAFVRACSIFNTLTLYGMEVLDVGLNLPRSVGTVFLVHITPVN